LEGVLEDAAIGVLSGERATPSGAARSWGTHSPLLTCSKLDVEYTADFAGGPAAVIAEGPTPHLGEFAYFEVLITACSVEKSGIGVGMVSALEESRLPGWPVGSFGYHGDDGNLYYGGVNNRSFGPTFGLGDVIGCGCDEIKGDLFFTLNGKFLGVAASGVNSFKLRPCVGLLHKGQRLSVNFGQNPFLWDFSFVSSSEILCAARSVVPEYPASPNVVCLNAADVAGGLWRSHAAALSPRLCFVDPDVHTALEQTQLLLAKWKT
jgi:hypothetical protein